MNSPVTSRASRPITGRKSPEIARHWRVLLFPLIALLAAWWFPVPRGSDPAAMPWNEPQALQTAQTSANQLAHLGVTATLPQLAQHRQIALGEAHGDGSLNSFHTLLRDFCRQKVAKIFDLQREPIFSKSGTLARLQRAHYYVRVRVSNRVHTFVDRILAYLERAESKEIDPWYRDDYRISWLTVLWSAQGVPDWTLRANSPAYVAATWQVLHCHPEKVWENLEAQRRAKLGAEYALIFPESIPHNKKQPMAESRGGFAPQKMCAYGALENTSSAVSRTAECSFETGPSCRTETKREAQRALTSEFGLNGEPAAGVAAPADKKPCASVRRSQKEHRA